MRDLEELKERVNLAPTLTKGMYTGVCYHFKKQFSNKIFNNIYLTIYPSVGGWEVVRAIKQKVSPFTADEILTIKESVWLPDEIVTIVVPEEKNRKNFLRGAEPRSHPLTLQRPVDGDWKILNGR